ncbi:MAG: family 4 glycosyl hydrolase [Promethearchaeota archaeon]|jgi:alpha-galactosidase
MTDRFKIAYIGAGSFRFSSEFFNDMILMSGHNSLPLEVGLCDINEKSLNLMKSYFSKVIETNRKYDPDIKISSSVNHRNVLENADFVYKSISVGIQESEWYDIYLPLKFGIPQNTGDTVGPGGIFRALRVIPAVLEIVKDMNELCPEAPLLNYTNPQSTVVLAARTVSPDIQYIGLCHELFYGMRPIIKYFKKYHKLRIKKWQDLDLKYVGVNHFAWLTEVGFSGEDLYKKLRDEAHKFVLDNYNSPVGDYYGGFNFHLLERYDYYPYPGSRHIAEFLPDYFNYFNYEIQTPYWGFPRARNVLAIGNMRKIAYQNIMDIINSKKTYTISGPSWERAMDMTLSYLNNDKTAHVVNIPNNFGGNKIFSQLPMDCIVEIPAYFNNGEMTPVDGLTVPDNIADLLIPHCRQQKMTVDAAIKNDIDLVFKAMMNDPMCNWIEDEDKVIQLTNIMLYYEQQWLPEEWSEWIPTKRELEQSKWWVSKSDLSQENKKCLEIKFSPNPELKSKSFFWR